MIKIERKRDKTAISPTFVGANRIQFNVKLLKTQREILRGNIDKHVWDSAVWGKSKAQLLKESENKCAYCEAPLKVVAFGDVEHYRPKSIYWWLAYNYENYLASCTLCNQAYKKDHFPLLDINARSSGPPITNVTTDNELESLAATINCDPLTEADGMSYQDFMNFHHIEKALLINPYYQDPEPIFEYKADDNLQEVEIFVKDTVEHSEEIYNAVVKNYGLNRLELKQLRYEWYDIYLTLKLTLEEQNISNALKGRIERKIENFKKTKSPFCGMVRYFEHASIE